MKESHKAIKCLIEVVAELADIARDLDPGRVATYDRVADHLEDARGALIQAKAFES